METFKKDSVLVVQPDLARPNLDKMQKVDRNTYKLLIDLEYPESQVILVSGEKKSKQKDAADGSTGKKSGQGKL